MITKGNYTTLIHLKMHLLISLFIHAYIRILYLLLLFYSHFSRMRIFYPPSVPIEKFNIDFSFNIISLLCMVFNKY